METLTARPGRKFRMGQQAANSKPGPEQTEIPVPGAGTTDQKIAKLEGMKALIVEIRELEVAKADKMKAFNKEIQRLQAQLFDLSIKNDAQYVFDFKG